MRAGLLQILSEYTAGKRRNRVIHKSKAIKLKDFIKN